MKSEMTIRLGAGKRIEALYDGFTICTDQSVESGGDASAPEPYDLFLASLGTCAAHYVRGFCERRQIPTAGIEIRQRWEREDKRLCRIILEIDLPAGFPARYRAAVIRAAEQCAVKRTIEHPPEMMVRIVPSPRES